MQILLVEDSDPLRCLFARVLRRRGFEVREASDGREALDCLERARPDLVLTDLHMPELDGLDLLRHLRSVPELGSVPVVVMTAGGTPEAEREAREAGAEFLCKPIDCGALLACVVGLS